MFFTHPVLGELYPEDIDWCVDEAAVPFHASRVHICLAEGGEDAPSDSANAGFDWIAANWKQVQKLIEQQAFEFYRPYADAVATVPKFAAPNELWGTDRLVSLRVYSVDDFSVTLRFDWQEDSDPHEVTFYVERGICETHSVDG
ncbi:MAG: hypothetical protein QNJ14_10460 [Woeseiaceae bacterium]|nr:hypothetical protein [Woeseiaceae bacterium]